MRSDSRRRYAIGLGSNLGDRLGNLRFAVEQMSTLGSVDGVSSLYETAPIGGPDQGPFLNAVVVLGSDLDPGVVLNQLHEIEQHAGRQRDEHWGPRTLDLDIVAYDGPSLDSPDLTIPHPRAAERVFVLRPLCDVWPEAEVGAGLVAARAATDVPDQDVDLLLKHWVTEPRWRGSAFVLGQFTIIVAAAVGMAYDGSLPDGEVTPVRLLGAVLAALGAVVALVSSRRLGSGFTANPVPKSETSLVTTGPFRLVRHPIYGGVSLLLIGTAMVLDSFWGVAIALLLIPFFWIKSSFEEKHLRILFPEYQTYVDTVPRRLIPFII